MSSHPTLRTLQLITLAGFLLHWLCDGHSMRSLVVFAFLVCLIAIPAWISKHYPGLGKVIGYLLIATPFINKRGQSELTPPAPIAFQQSRTALIVGA